MKTFYQFLAAQILGWLYGLTADDLAKAKDHVLVAETKYETAAEKWLYVKAQLQQAWPKVAAIAINLAIELAVSFIKKKP